MQKLPQEISPCPIVEVTIEIKFSTKLPHNAIVGIVYNAFKDEFSNIESLPISQIPEEIRLNDPNFKFKVFHRFAGVIYSIQVGFDVITLHCNSPYSGWGKFFPEITKFIERVKSTNIISHVVSVSLRYINFFQDDIFKNTNVSIEIMGNKVEDGKSVMRFELPHGEYIQVYQIANNTEIEDQKKGVRMSGSLLDITIIQESPQNFFEKSNEIIDKMHTEEKNIFFGLLNKDFLLKLNPSYKL